ncbi:hypothetical protein ABBQ38_005277 [Trebouxia sp. C0009 RCD-2024]
MLSRKKGPRKPSKSATSSFAGVSQAAGEDQQIHLLDSGAVKRELDEGSIRAAKAAGLREDHFVSNVKILLGLLTCSIAAVAQFYPRKHPDNWWLLLCCVVAYATCTAALNLFLLRFEGEVFFFSQSRKDLPALKFIAKMPRYSDQYTLLISKRGEQDHPNSILHLMPWLAVLKSCIPGLHSTKSSQSSDQAEMTHSATKYFHSDGYLNQALLSEDVQQLLRQPNLSSKGKSL